MTKDQLKIVFFGTPDFAVASLKAIADAGFNIVAVVTAPDRPAGRGLKVQASAVKEFAVERGFPVLQPTNLKSPEFQEELASYGAQIQVVIAFRMLPEKVWNMPPFGTFNLHASLLPKYRGAAPINRAIMNGEKVTGVSTFFLQHAIDTGNLVFQEEVAIPETMNAGELHDVLMETGAGLVVKTLDAVLAGSYPQVPQPEGEFPMAPKIFKEDCELKPEWPVVKVYNHMRGLSPYPGAWTTFKGKQLKVFAAEKKEEPVKEGIGEWIQPDRKTMLLACQGGYLSVKEVQWEGKKRMGVEEFLRGVQG